MIGFAVIAFLLILVELLLMYLGTIEQVLLAPRESVTNEFLAAMFLIDITKQLSG